MMDMTEPQSDPDALHDEDTRTRVRTLAKAQADHEARIRSVEAWPMRLLLAIAAGALGMIGTVAGFGWSLSAQLARMEARLDSAAESDERRDTRIDRLEDRTDQTYTRNHGGE